MQIHFCAVSSGLYGLGKVADMFLMALIVLLIVMILSTTKIMMRRNTGKDSWGEPAVTIVQVILIIVMVVFMAMDMSM